MLASYGRTSFNARSRFFPPCSHGCRIILFAAALAIQIFRPKERPTVTTLGVECLILVLFGIMCMRVMWLFSRHDDEDDAETSEEHEPLPAVPQDDVEQGTAKCCIFYGRR